MSIAALRNLRLKLYKKIILTYFFTIENNSRLNVCMYLLMTFIVNLMEYRCRG